MADILTTMAELQVVAYVNASAATLVVYDTILNFRREWVYIWKRQWSLAKVLYLFCRYYSTISVLYYFIMSATVQRSILSCKIFMVFVVAGQSVVIQWVLQIITVLRLYALYGRSKTLLAILSSLYVVTSSIELYASSKLAQSNVAAVQPTPPGIPLTGCILSNTVDQTFSTMLVILFMAFDLLLFSLMFLKYVDYLKRCKRHHVDRGSNPIHAVTPVLRAFYTTGAIWYLLQTMMTMVYVGVYYSLQGATKSLITPWLAVVQCISGTRLILNLRESAHLERVRNGSGTANTSPVDESNLGGNPIPSHSNSGNPNDFNEDIVFRQLHHSDDDGEIDFGSMIDADSPVEGGPGASTGSSSNSNSHSRSHSRRSSCFLDLE